MTQTLDPPADPPVEPPFDPPVDPPLDPRSLFDLAGRSVVVTGASRGLGAVVARGLAAAGARVAVVGRSRQDVIQVVAEIVAGGGEALAVPGDISAPDGPAEVVATVVEAFGGIDVLVNNAGVSERYPVESISREAFRRVHDLNVEAALFLCQAASPHLRASGRGSVVNVLSTGIWTGGAGSVLYRSSKSALRGLTMVLAREWAAAGIRVNAIAPGAFAAGMGAGLAPERVTAHLERTPMGRLGRPEELVPAVLFLACDASSYVTGTVVRVDGGMISQ